MPKAGRSASLLAGRVAWLGRYAAKAWPALAAFAGLVVVGTLSGLVVPWVQQDLLNGVLHGGVTGRVWALLGAWAALAVLGQAAGAGGRLLRTRVDLRLGVLGRADAYRHVLALPHVEVAGRGTSQVLSDLDYAADATGVPTMVIDWVVGLGTRVIGASGALLLLSGPVLLASAPFVLGYVVLPRVLARWIRSAERAEQETRTEVRAVVLDQVEGMRDVRLFGAGSWALGRLHAAWLQSVRAAWRTAVAHGGSDTLNWALRTGAYLAAWAVGLHDVQAGRLGAGGLLAITLYLGALFDPLDRVLSLQYHWIGWMLDVDRTIALQRRSAGEAFGAPRGVGPQAADGSIQVDGLEVRYPGQERSALRLRAFRVDSGETVALVGPNGSGKSTLLACLLDLVRPVRGRIRHGGAPLGEIREDALRAQVAGLLPEPAVFGGTIADNLRLAKPDAPAADLLAALGTVGLDDWIKQQPEGLETRIGRQGAPLSSGQRQRLGVARVLLRDAPVWVLDEPTSAIDPASVEALWEKLRGHSGRTVVVATHSPVIAASVDRVVTLQDGLAVE